MSERPLPLESLEVLARGLDHPEGVCETLDGRLYVGGEAGQLYEIEPDGGVRELSRTHGFMLGLAADAAGRIYAADVGHHCVWRIDPDGGGRALFTAGTAERPLRTPNWGAFGPDGSYYLSDSGQMGAGDGCLLRVPPGGAAEVWSEECCDYPNGLAVDRDGARLYVVESYPGALVAFDIRPDGGAGPRELLCDLDPAVPDGVTLVADGSMLIACYRPDAIYRWSEGDGLRVLAEDPRGQVLAAPANVLFTGPARDEIVVANVGGWHLTRMRTDMVGEPLHYPTADQLGG